MVRHDPGRGASSDQELADQLHLQWVRQLPVLDAAWPAQEKLWFDRIYEPVVVGHTMFVGSSMTDSVTAYDTRTGEESWKFHADGPVRFAPVAHRGKVFFSSDDGYLYCLDADRGSLLWKFRGGPSDRKILGNGRLISTWPARGGPVVADDVVYFAASIWPFMGVFIHALDTEMGQVVWTNDGDGSMYIKQPHNTYSFAGVAPQGALVVSGDKLLVPGGRSVPACYDRHTGQFLYYHLAENSKRAGGAAVAATGNAFINGGHVFELSTGDALGGLDGPFVFDHERFYVGSDGGYRVLARPEVKEVEEVDRKGKKSKVKRFVFDDPLLSLEAPVGADLIRAGSRLYGCRDHLVFAVELDSAGEKKDPVSWRTKVEGLPVRLLAADDRLFAVTRKGRIYCFGADEVKPTTFALYNVEPRLTGQSNSTAAGLIKATGVKDGYCLFWGVGDGTLITRLLAETDLYIIGIDPDVERATSVREQLSVAGIYGRRASIHVGTPETIELPPYLASLVVIDDRASAGMQWNSETISRVFSTLRPYGGIASVLMPQKDREAFVAAMCAAKLPGASVTRSGELILFSRKGALPGSANWTHEHADASNTRVSKDRLVRAPLGILWFGGPTNEQILPRHGHGPQPQVVDGRLIIEGSDLLRAIDIYTGRLLWERQLPDFGELFSNTGHHPGANGTGSNYVSLSDGIYAIQDRICLRLNPATGETMSEFELPTDAGDDRHPRWRYVNVVGDYLIAGSDLSAEEAEKDRSKRYDATIASKRITVLERNTGEALWSIDAVYEFRHNAVCSGGGRLYCIDLLSAADQERLKRRGEEPPHDSRLAVYDLSDGRLIWDTRDQVFGTWLGYSEKFDVLIETGRPGRDVLKDEATGMRTFAALDGTPLWSKDYKGPPLIHGDRLLISSRQACELLTGELVNRTDPVTGRQVAWKWSRNYGCNTPQGSEHLLVFRSGAAGYYDLAGDGGTGNFGGFRSSCTNNLIVAGGVLTAPDYTRTCTCGYQNQTSVGLIHMPEAEMWTQFELDQDEHHGVQQLGINLGAPGQRRCAEGRLWLNAYKGVKVEADDNAYYNGHSAKIAGQGPAWVAASGCRGIRRLEIDTNQKEQATYVVRLHFCDSDNDRPRQRVFDVALHGQTVLSALDIVRESGGKYCSIVKQFPAKTDNHGKLVLTFKSHGSNDSKLSASPVLSGFELVRQD